MHAGKLHFHFHCGRFCLAQGIRASRAPVPRQTRASVRIEAAFEQVGPHLSRLWLDEGCIVQPRLESFNQKLQRLGSFSLHHNRIASNVHAPPIQISACYPSVVGVACLSLGISPPSGEGSARQTTLSLPGICHSFPITFSPLRS